MDLFWKTGPIDPWILIEGSTYGNVEVQGLLCNIPKTGVQLHLYSGIICNSLWARITHEMWGRVSQLEPAF